MASIFRNVTNVNIAGGSFVIQNTAENISVYEKFANHITAEAFHDADVSPELPKCHPGTREAIKKDLIKWVEDKCRPYPIYHLYGPAGSGKTAIAKTLADHCSSHHDPSRKTLLATFFFSRKAENRSNARTFIATIAYQIAMNLPPSASYIVKAATDPSIFQRDLFSQMRTLLLNPLRNACTRALKDGHATSSWPRLLVIDGLDECHDKEAQINVLKVITELARYQPFPLAILVSCRHGVSIRSTFTDPHLRMLALKIDLSTKYDSKSDIRKFLVLKFNDIREQHRLATRIAIPPEWPGLDVINKLVRKSSGHFIYASVITKYVGDLDANPFERLKIVLSPRSITSFPATEEQWFAELDALYSQILASIKDTHLPTVLNAFKFALVPHGGTMLLDEPQIRMSLANLKGTLISLLSHERHRRRPEIEVAFLHCSFREFLLESARSGPYYINLENAHADIAMYLLQNYIENNNGRESSARAIYSLIGHLRLATPTTELQHRLLRLAEENTFTKVFKYCNRPDDLGLSFDVWKVLHSLGLCLGKLPFEGALIMEQRLLGMMKDHLRNELGKYAQEPLNKLITLVMCGARLPQEFFGKRPLSESSAREDLLSLILEKFNLLEFRTIDESSLNLLALLKADQACLRGLIEEIKYMVDPRVYTTACINALQCLAEISLGAPKNSPESARSGGSMNLSDMFSSFRQEAEAKLQDPEEEWWWLDYVPLASLFTHFFTDFVLRLLEHAKPSSKEIAEYLVKLEKDIMFLCRCATRVNMHGVRTDKEHAKAVVRKHQNRASYPPSQYSVHPLALPEPRIIPITKSKTIP